MTKKQKKVLIRIIVSAVLLAAIMIITKLVEINKWIQLVLYLVPYLIIGYDILKKALKGIFKGQIFDENFLMAVATVGAVALGEFSEGAAVMLFYQVGELFQSVAVGKSRKNITSLMDIRPDYANVELNGKLEKIDPDDVEIGTEIVVNPGEKVPIDGIIISGDSTLNTSALTGESVPRSAEVGDEIISGCINLTGVLRIKTTKEFGDSTVSKILELVENATDKKAKTETFVAKAAKIYTPVVLILAIIVALFMPLVFSDITYSQSIYRALIFLVISCPCAIAISVPLSYFSGIGRASKEGILIKGSNYLDSLKDISKIVFDKTGTITTGKFEVSSITSNDEKINSKDDILRYVAMAEKFSNHPIAKSILDKINYTVDTSEVENFEEIAGKGLKYTFNGNEYKVGNFTQKERYESGTIIYLLKNGVEIGSVILRDGLKKDTKDAISKLNNMKIETLMYTGDNEKVASQVANEVGIEKYKSKMLPYDKYSELENMLNNKEKGEIIAFVGDGINDSPVLALSDVGISMGGVGQQAAIEASDVVIMTDSLDKIVSSIKISKKTVKIIKENLTFAIGVKVLVLVLSAIGIAGMWQAVFADVGVTLITILNTLRILRK